MDEYERLKAQKDAILKRQQDAKDKRIDALEAETLQLRVALQDLYDDWQGPLTESLVRARALLAACGVLK